MRAFDRTIPGYGVDVQIALNPGLPNYGAAPRTAVGGCDCAAGKSADWQGWCHLLLTKPEGSAIGNGGTGEPAMQSGLSRPVGSSIIILRYHYKQ